MGKYLEKEKKDYKKDYMSMLLVNQSLPYERQLTIL
jgi:hypothetical protein